MGAEDLNIMVTKTLSHILQKDSKSRPRPRGGPIPHEKEHARMVPEASPVKFWLVHCGRTDYDLGQCEAQPFYFSLQDSLECLCFFLS